MDNITIGVLGGGQLGRMMAYAGHRIGLKLAVLDPGGSASPAGQVSELCIEGSFRDGDKLEELATVCDIITAEIEHIDVSALEGLEQRGFNVQPHSSTFRVIQNKFRQKQFMELQEVPVAPFCEVVSVEDCLAAGRRFGYPFVLKNALLAYDGRGNVVVRSAEVIEECFTRLGGEGLYAEQFVPFAKELAVMVVRTRPEGGTEDDMMCFPLVETLQRDGICDTVVCPAQVPESVRESALAVARQAVGCLRGQGVFGVELFMLPDGQILYNEIAPRPHNSGHYTIESCEMDQFEMHLRAVASLPCPPPALRVPHALMVNIIGQDSEQLTREIMRRALDVAGAAVHWYGKSELRRGRKLGHITLTGPSEAELVRKADALGVDRSRHGLFSSNSSTAPIVGIVMGSDTDLPTMQDAALILDHFQIPYELTIVSAHRTPSRMYSYAQSAVERGLRVIVAGAGGAAHLPGMIAALTPLPVVGVPIKTSALSGNDSLLSIVQMPRGIPVATVAIGNAVNAGLLAARILGASDIRVRLEMEAYMSHEEEVVLSKAVKLETLGFTKYINDALGK